MFVLVRSFTYTYTHSNFPYVFVDSPFLASFIIIIQFFCVLPCFGYPKIDFNILHVDGERARVFFASLLLVIALFSRLNSSRLHRVSASGTSKKKILSSFSASVSVESKNDCCSLFNLFFCIHSVRRFLFTLIGLQSKTLCVCARVSAMKGNSKNNFVFILIFDFQCSQIRLFSEKRNEIANTLYF